MSPLLDERVAAAQDRWCVLVGEDRQYLVDRIAPAGRIFAVALGGVFAIVELVRFVDVAEGVEALVHPGVAPFVEADDDREARMHDPGRADPELFLARIVDDVEHDARVFHPRPRHGAGRQSTPLNYSHYYVTRMPI